MSGRQISKAEENPSIKIYLILEWCNRKASLTIFPKMDLKTQYLLQNGWVFENHLSFYKFQVFHFFHIIGSKVIVVWESQYIFHDALVCSNGLSSGLLNINYSNTYFPVEWRMQTLQVSEVKLKQWLWLVFKLLYWSRCSYFTSMCDIAIEQN